jgi:hypothetical protein
MTRGERAPIAACKKRKTLKKSRAPRSGPKAFRALEEAPRAFALTRGSRLVCWNLPALRAAVARAVSWPAATHELQLAAHRVGSRHSLCFAWEHPVDSDKSVCAIVNGYGPRGQVSHHSDDEPQLCQEIPVLTYSFGRSMTFEVLDKETRGARRRVALATGDGTLVAMEGSNFQEDYTHAAWPVPGAPGGAYRVSVSVRVCRGWPAKGYFFKGTKLHVRSLEQSGRDLEELARLCVEDAVSRWGVQ